MLICSVVGARPNFMKMAPVVEAVRRRGLPHVLVHTGQHYDEAMSRVFFEELGMPEPDVNLEIGSDTPTRQTSRILLAFEEFCLRERPNLVLVGGDVTSTLAVALVASRLGIPIGHVEAGLRSFDRTMPEEINRVITDHLSTFLFTTEESANRNLEREGIRPEMVHFVGNCMIDTLKRHVESAVARAPWKQYDVEPGEYALLTLHRPSNVDATASVQKMMEALGEAAGRLPVLFPVHPRTLARLREAQVLLPDGIRSYAPFPYETFLGLMARARVVLTDSGGIQEETTALGVPCLTLRENTERPVTLTHGTNRLVGSDRAEIRRSVESILAGDWPSGSSVPLWDGQAGSRIAAIIESTLAAAGARRDAVPS
jgi:UDP-N-acetylglucosamine 2-epimerase (non-hydrolysing)